MSPLINKFLFWQPQKDYFRTFSSTPTGTKLLIITNYLIWFFFFYVSFLLVKDSANTFWQILLATIVSELLEKYLKVKCFWKRPFNNGKNHIPDGFLKAWYRNGSFPSGHTIKSTFFFFFILQYQVFSPTAYLLFSLPLLTFRILVGLHYPIDVLGGALIGILIWISTYSLLFPDPLVNFIKSLFALIFLK